MSQIFNIHPKNPQSRLIEQAAKLIIKGGVAIYPTDSSYALGCHMGDKAALERICKIKNLDAKHHFTLVCRDLKQLGQFAQVNNSDFRLIKAHTPGPYTFILKATKDVPKRLLHPKRKSIGIRVPDDKITLALLEEVGEPIMSTSLQLPGDEYPISDPDDIIEKLDKRVDVIINGGFGGMDFTSVVDFSHDQREIVREGLGDTSFFL